MKPLLTNFYDKIILFCFLTVLLAVSLYSFVFKGVEIPSMQTTEFSQNWNRSSGGIYYSSTIPIGLMPGDFINFSDPKNDQNLTGVGIVSVEFGRRSEVVVNLLDGSSVNGTVKSKEGLKIKKDWRKSNEILLIDDGEKTVSIPHRQIKRLIGTPKYYVRKDFNFKKLKDADISFYQKVKEAYPLTNLNKISSWDHLQIDSNQSFYDLFTPPLIYLIDGKLTTSLPTIEAEEEVEPFGFSVISFTEKPYRFVLKSWIGNSPYLEDIVLSEKFGSNARTRLEVNGSYRIAESPQRGQPTLIKVEADDPTKLLTLNYFTVQQVPQKTGGVKPVGRALIEDKTVSDEPFEINSLMPEVYLGQFDLKVEILLEDKDKLELTLTEVDEGRIIEYYGRKYKILKINLEKKSVLISKQVGLSPELEELELFAP